MKKCNQRLFEKATPKICDQKRLAVTIEFTKDQEKFNLCDQTEKKIYKSFGFKNKKIF